MGGVIFSLVVSRDWRRLFPEDRLEETASRKAGSCFSKRLRVLLLITLSEVLRRRKLCPLRINKVVTLATQKRTGTKCRAPISVGL
jgi:hypothetical protein